MERLCIKACCVSMDYTSSEKTLELGKQSDFILPFIGVHPEKAQDEIESTLKLIDENNETISGIGEIGLDTTYTNSAEEFQKQEEVFKTQLSYAEKFGKPVSIHSRKTLDQILEILPSYKIPSVLLHWFDGSKKQMQKAMDLQCYVSFGPVMVYSQDKQVLLSKANKDRILVETDGPVRFSRCFENKTAQIELEATTSIIGEDQIFYCNQRGLNQEEAVSLIVNGFCKEVLQQLPMEFAVEAQKLVGISLEGSVG